MARKLTVREIEAIRDPGRHHTGDGLYLQVRASGARTWLFRYMRAGRAREMGLGSASTVKLADARLRANEARRLLAEGHDPIEHRRQIDRAQEQEQVKAKTFRQVADDLIKSKESGWRNAKHRYQWRATLETYAYPVFGDLPVAEVDTDLVLKALEPIWRSKTETASRLRGRIEAVLDYARVKGYRQGPNPALWRGHLSHLLPAPSDVQTIQHQPALPYAEMPAFMARLRERDGTSARALEFVILTAARTGEVLGARWREFDLADGVWTVPAERMKARREHRVPLSTVALDIVEGMRDEQSSDAFVFAGQRADRPLSQMALLMLLRRLERTDITVHGFRSTFRDWVAEQTDFPGDVAEAALAHKIPNKVEAAYRRGDLFDKRRQLMEVWASHCYAG